MFRAQGRPVEREQASSLEDAIDDGLCEIVVMEHTPPGGERLVGREDHGPLLPMPIVDNVKRACWRRRTVGEIADLVDDQ
jgi:hypothetical protein